MKKKVAEKIVKGITDKIECNTADIDDWAEFWGFTRDEYEEFLDMAIKALEQKPSKDEVILTNKEYRELVSNEYENGYANGYREALEQEDILDKIRAEIEKAIWEDVIVSLDGTDETRIPCLDPDDVFDIIDKYKENN